MTSSGSWRVSLALTLSVPAACTIEPESTKAEIVGEIDITTTVPPIPHRGQRRPAGLSLRVSAESASTSVSPPDAA